MYFISDWSDWEACASHWLPLLVNTRHHMPAIIHVCHVFMALFVSLIHSYLLVKSLSPGKDLEQPVSISWSSSTQSGGRQSEARRTGEEGTEVLEQEDAEPSLSISFNKHSPPFSFSSGALPQASIPPPRSVSDPGSRSMADKSLRSCGLMPGHMWVGGATTWS